MHSHTFTALSMAGTSVDDISISNYVLQTLNSAPLQRYTEKCKEIGNIDPYNIPRHSWKDITTLLGGDVPDLRHSDIYQYLINFKSVYNHKELKV